MRAKEPAKAHRRSISLDAFEVGRQRLYTEEKTSLLTVVLPSWAHIRFLLYPFPLYPSNFSLSLFLSPGVNQFALVPEKRPLGPGLFSGFDTCFTGYV